MVNMALPSKRVIQVFLFIIVWNGVKSSGILEDPAVSKIHLIPSYRFHYYVRDDKNGDHKQREDSNNGDNVHGSDSNKAVRTVNYRTESPSELETEVTVNAGTSLFHSVLNNGPQQQSDNTQKSTILPINTHDQYSVKVYSTDHLVDDYSTTQLTEQMTTNQPEDRRTNNVTDEQVVDQLLYQKDGISNKQFELRLPLEKQITSNSSNSKYSDDAVMRQNIVKVIENINDGKQSCPKLHLTSLFYRKLLKITDALKIEPQKSSQTLSNKPLKLLGYNPSTIGSQYDMNIHYNQTSQVPQQHSTGFSVHSDKMKSDIHASSTIQPISQQENDKYLTPMIYTQIYYYDPISMIMLPISNGMIHNTYSFVDNKPQSTQLAKPKFNIFNFLRGRGKRSLKMPFNDYQMGSDPMKITLGLSSQVNYNDHMQYVFSPTDPDTPIDIMPICKDCGPVSERNKRSLNMLLNDHQKSTDPMETTLGQLLWPRAI